jgi:hypothetical protein
VHRAQVLRRTLLMAPFISICWLLGNSIGRRHMKTTKWRRALRPSVIVIALMVLYAAPAASQQEFELPGQHSQAQSPIYRYSTPAPSPGHQPSGGDVSTIPQVSPQVSGAPTAPPRQPPSEPPPQIYQNHSQPVLPAVFRGCWQGTVEYVDSIERLPGGAKVGFWTPKTYRLCYRRVGNGPFVLTFTEAGMEANDRITNANGRMTLRTTDGRSYASMRSDLTFDEYRSRRSSFGGDTFAVHEITNLDCRVDADGMHVQGAVSGWRSGEPWFRARWHATFVHIGEPPQEVAAPGGGVPE